MPSLNLGPTRYRPRHRRPAPRTPGRALLVALVALPLLFASTMAAAHPKGATVPVLRLSPVSGQPGATVAVTVEGFPRKASGTLTFDGAAVGSFRTNPRGKYNGSIVVPKVSARTATVKAVVGSSVVSAPVVVVASAPAPTPTPVEPTPPPPTPQPPAPAPGSNPPPAGGYFTLKPPGSFSSLPSDAAAASMVRRSTWEPRPQNAKANATRPGSFARPGYGGMENGDALFGRVTGNFTGTTDEIIQWAAAKWGLPDNVIRAEAVTESNWYQGLLDSSGNPINGRGYGDFGHCGAVGRYGNDGPSSFGIMQIKWCAHENTYPMSERSTAFNLDYYGALMRGCYEGWDYMGNGYARGDLWGCVGRWFSGDWYGQGAVKYINSVKGNLADKPWLKSGF